MALAANVYCKVKAAGVMKFSSQQIFSFIPSQVLFCQTKWTELQYILYTKAIPSFFMSEFGPVSGNKEVRLYFTGSFL